MSALEQRGFFWWSDEEVPTGRLAPYTAVAGLLVIEDDGRPRIELDALLTPITKVSANHQDSTGASVLQSISGILKGTGERAIMSGVQDSEHNFRTGSVSHQSFRGWTCIVGSGAVVQSAEELVFAKMRFRLDEHLDWFKTNSFSREDDSGDLKISYKKPSSMICDLADGQLTIEFNLSTSFIGRGAREIEAKEQVLATYVPQVPLDWEGVRNVVSHMQDFLLLQTNVFRRLGWPVVQIEGEEDPYQLYYPISIGDMDSFSENRCWVHFAQLRSSFSLRFEQFCQRLAVYESAFFLYTATRRNFQISVEHHFISLAWGLEAFHRVKYSKDKGHAPKTGRISLSQRLEELLGNLPIGREKVAFKRFCDRFGRIRNDISHHGMIKNDGSYKESMLELQKFTLALEFCYHLLILSEIGIEGDFLQQRIQWYMMSRNLIGILSEFGIGPVSDIRIAFSLNE